MITRQIWATALLSNGPGTTPQPHIQSAGLLAYIINWQLDCFGADIPVATDAPEIGACITVDQCAVVYPRQAPKVTFDAIAAHLGIFGAPGHDEALESYLGAAEIQLADRVDEFGTGGPNLDALDAIDISGYPAIFAAFKSNYYAAFQFHDSYVPAQNLATIDTEAGSRWNQTVITSLFDIFEEDDLNTTPHRLERWFNHAMWSVTVSGLRTYLGR